MDFAEQIETVLLAANSQYPEVQSIETGYQVSETSKYYIRINTGDKEFTEAGECQKKPVKQSAFITVIGKIGREDSVDSIKSQTENIFDIVKTVLDNNPTLGGFLMNKGSVTNEADGEDSHGKDDIVFFQIDFEGEYWE